MIRVAWPSCVLLGVQLLVEADLADRWHRWDHILGPLVKGLIVNVYVASLEVDDGSARNGSGTRALVSRLAPVLNRSARRTTRTRIVRMLLGNQLGLIVSGLITIGPVDGVVPSFRALDV